MNNTKTFSLIIYLDKEARLSAKEFASRYTLSEKSNQVYYNTLAVYAVNKYLQVLGIKTELKQGDSWNPLMQAILNVADIILPNIGKLECCPVLFNETKVKLISNPIQDNLIGYVAVRFDEDLSQAELLGFIPYDEEKNLPETIDIVKLKSYKLLIDILTEREAVFLVAKKEQNNQINLPVVLSQWFKGIFDEIWQSVGISFSDIEASMTIASTGCSQETSLKRKKLINLGNKGDKVWLIISLNKNEGSEEAIKIVIEVKAFNEQVFLPEQLELACISAMEETISKRQVTQPRQNLPLEPIQGEPGDSFSVKLSLGEIKVTEKFIV